MGYLLERINEITTLEEQACAEEVSRRNLHRSRLFALVLLAMHAVLIFIDLNRRAAGGWARLPAYRHLFELHVVIAAGLLVFLLASSIRSLPPPGRIGLWERILTRAFLVFLLAMSAMVSVVDQQIHGQITVYIIATLGVAASAYLSLLTGALAYGVAFIAFLISISVNPSGPDKMAGLYINGSVLTVVAFVVSRLMYTSFRRDFTNRLIIEKQKRELERQSKEDSLTGLYNRRYMEMRMSEEYERARRYNHPLSVAMADIDHFKDINDDFSHQVGDEVLKQIARIFRLNIRSIDVIARYGGEEFLIIFPETHLGKARLVCEKNRQAVESFDWSHIQPGLSVTISFGVFGDALLPHYEKMISAADRLLYDAKRAGRNRVMG